MLAINLSYWEMKEKWVTTVSLGPFAFLLNFHYGRITYQPTGAKVKSIPLNTFIYLPPIMCSEPVRVGKQR